MTHMVSFYPDRISSLETAKALIDGGCSYLEIQFPFSEPTADGIFIQNACAQAIRQGFKVPLGFEQVCRIRRIATVPIFIMCYANSLFFHGVETFLEECSRAGADGLIVPDLPPDYDEGLFRNAKRTNLTIVPVIAPVIRQERIRMIVSHKPEYLYTTLRKGVTGSYTEIGEENIRFLQRIGTYGIKILAGFGISVQQQLAALAPYVHASVVGSAFIKEIMNREDKSIYTVVREKMHDLLDEDDHRHCPVVCK